MTREKAIGIALGNINPISNEVMADFSPQKTKVRNFLQVSCFFEDEKRGGGEATKYWVSHHHHPPVDT